MADAIHALAPARCVGPAPEDVELLDERAQGRVEYRLATTRRPPIPLVDSLAGGFPEIAFSLVFFWPDQIGAGRCSWHAGRIYSQMACWSEPSSTGVRRLELVATDGQGPTARTTE